jgi:hypothetical protein
LSEYEVTRKDTLEAGRMLERRDILEALTKGFPRRTKQLERALAIIKERGMSHG